MPMEQIQMSKYLNIARTGTSELRKFSNQTAVVYEAQEI